MKKLWWIVWMLGSCGFPRPPDLQPPDGGGDAPGNTACQLTAIEPPQGGTGDSITLEGTFADAVTVNFPGGPKQATVLGPHRARVVVPAEATTGDLTVTSCGTKVGPLAFRHVSFTLGLTGFGSIFDQANVARQTPKLFTAREGPAAVVVGGGLYVLGGAASTGPLGSVEHARIEADGALGPFEPDSGVSFVIARQGHTVTPIGSFVYAVGGSSAGGPLNSVERATVARGGSLSSFELLPAAQLTARRRGHASVLIGNSLYVLGGSDGTPLDSIERATIDADGSLEPFVPVSGVHLAMGRSGHTALVVGDSLYVIGGAGSHGLLGDVERAQIHADGSLGAFTVVAGSALATPRSGHTAIVLGNVLYVVGGAGDSGSLSSVEAAALDADGLPGPFNTLSAAMPIPRRDHAMIVVANYVYMLGGAGVSALDSIEWATLVNNGELQPPMLAGGNFAVPRYQSTSVVVGNYLYMIGGAATGSDSVERATLDAAGMLGPFAKVPELTLTTPRHRHAAAVIGNYLYVIGGVDDAGPLKTVERAVINPDGSLGAFANTVTLTAPRMDHSSAVIGNFLYVIGGSDGSKLLGSVERAPINPDGSLGAFQTVPGVVLRTPRQGHHSAVIGNNLYILGGDTNAIEQAPINSDGSLGSFVASAASLENQSRFEATCALLGRQLHVIGGEPDLFGTGTSEHALVTANGSLMALGASAVGPMLRTGHSAVAIGNYLYIIGGVDMNGVPVQPSTSALLLFN